ncbi:enoyl-CoA hydratase/isomerase family protein [Nesterenkonia ebinurensis]|uniref:enoyl-CoA hydratase/isomerase family protein n=1 Tax=Nesterenkonia ebinurensis TaxID=2608252 RepID=UPI00123CB3A7|nr:enoyl-CoA hydratase-related protein [Nesterenkonia ebinurensis]
MIDLTIDEGLAEVVLSAPEKLNSLDEAALAQLEGAYQEAEAAGVRALLLRGEGRGFCAGRDISGVIPADDDVLGYLGGKVTPLLHRMAQFPAPTFAAVQGACLGVGLGLAIATDVVYVAEDAKIGSPFASLGATLDSGGHALFVERLGVHRTLDLIYTAELISGSEAVAAGLFSRAVPADELVEFTREKAQRAASGATLAFRESKKLVAQIRDERIGLWESLDAENRAQAALCATEDYAEGFAAFQTKRRPTFKGH